MQTRSDSPGALLDNLLTAVILVDGDFVVHYVNPAAEQLLGISARRLLQNRFDRVVEYISLDLERLRTAQRQGQGFSDGEVTLVIDGDPKLVDLSVVTISEPPNHRILMELRKIDQQKRISQELQQHAQQLAARDLVRGLAHEIKNPLGGLRGAAQLLEKALPDVALKEYTGSKGKGRPTVDAHEAYSVLEEKLDVLRSLLHGFDYSDFLTGGHKLLAGAANHVLC